MTLTLSGAALPMVGRARIYVCGITPYDVTHLGHASTYVWADLVGRVLRSGGTPVTLARNVTDVDEVLLAEAQRRGKDFDALAALGRFDFDRTMSALRVRPPEHEPTARQSIEDVIGLARALLVRHRAYVVDGTVYARTRDARHRCGLSEADAVGLAREFGDEPDDGRREHPLDVVLWRAVAGEDVGWPSPWGRGRPGWHAECAAMVLATFGPALDIHAGGADLRFPHHAVEADLAESATGVAPFARAWLQVGVVGHDGSKMAKSTGNLVLDDDLLDEVGPAVVRLACLHRPWGEDWTFTPAVLDAAAVTLEELHAASAKPDDAHGADEVDAALLADLDVVRAVGVALSSGGAAARRLVEVLALS